MHSQTVWIDIVNRSTSVLEEEKEDDKIPASIRSQGNATYSNRSGSDIASGAPSKWKKYDSYTLVVDPEQDDRADEIKLCNFSRPHMRAFHFSWLGFFISYFMWFAIAPLLAEIRTTLNLTKKEIWSSSIAGVGGTMFMRFLLGPLCDKVGPRIPFAIVLCCVSIPAACTGLVSNAINLAVLRLFIGAAGGSLVMSQYWTSGTFTKEVAGTANGLVVGWGTLGGAVSQLVMGAALFPLFKEIFKNEPNPPELAWRWVSIVHAVVAFTIGVCIYLFSDDCPKGNYSELKKNGTMVHVSAAASFCSGALNLNAWFLCIQYGCCAGVELTMNNAAALYFKDQFNLTTEEAAAIASIFGWASLLFCALGGFCSDKANARAGMRGRLWVHFTFLACEGALVLLFANTPSLAGAIAVMVAFSVFVQAAQGSTYGILPYIDPPSTGSIAGIIGAGGNIGAIAFQMGFRELGYKDAFAVMGCTIIASSFLSFFVCIRGSSCMIGGKDVVPHNTNKTEDIEAEGNSVDS